MNLSVSFLRIAFGAVRTHPRTLATALALLGTAAVANPQSSQLEPQRVHGPLGKVHYDLGTGTVTKLVRSGKTSGSAETTATGIGDDKNLVIVFRNTITTGYFTSGTLGAEFVDWAGESWITLPKAGFNVLHAWSFAYATTVRDTTASGPGASLDLSFYTGTTGFCTLGSEIGRFNFTGLPGATASVPPGFGVGFLVTAFLAAGSELIIPPGPIGWGYCLLDSDGSGGSLTGPLMTDFGTNTGWNDAFDFWAKCPASTGTCAGAFFFGGCLTGMVPPPPTGTPCASFYWCLVFHVPLTTANCTFRNGLGCNPADLVVTCPPGIGASFKAITACPIAVYAVTPGAFPLVFKLAGVVKGELLCDPTTIFGGIQVITTGAICIPIPIDSGLDGFCFCIQAAEFKGPGCFQLTNAYDCKIGG